MTTFPVAASPERVWQTLTDLDSYPDWNPQIPHAAGSAEVGQQIDLRLALPGRPALNVTATVERSEQGRALHWSGHVLAPWFFHGQRTFDIEATSDGCTVTHVERITGALAPVFGLAMGGPTQRSHDALNQALKRRAEQEHAA